MSDKQALAATSDNFFAALNILFKGDAEPMKEVWSHADDTTYLGPDGLMLVGWKLIEQEWKRQADSKLGGHVTPKNMHTVLGVDLAVITCIESGENIINGTKQVVEIRSSTVFRKEHGVWKVIGHQTDLLDHLAHSR